MRNVLRMAVAYHPEDEQGLHVHDRCRGQDVFSLEQAVDGVAYRLENLLRYVPPRGRNETHGVQQYGRRGVVRDELFSGDNRKHGGHVDKVRVNQLFDHVALYAQVDRLRQRELQLALFGLVYADNSVSIRTQVPRVVVSQVVCFVCPRGDQGVRMEQVSSGGRTCAGLTNGRR